MTHLPCASITVAPRGVGVRAAGPTVMMRLPLMRIVVSPAIAASPSSSGWSTVAPTIAVVFSVVPAAHGAAEAQASSKVMITGARRPRPTPHTPSGSAAMVRAPNRLHPLVGRGHVDAGDAADLS